MKTLADLHRLRNTQIEGNEDSGKCFLYGNLIATWTPTTLSVSLARFNTVTTRRRLNQIINALDVHAYVGTRNFLPYLSIPNQEIQCLNCTSFYNIERTAS